MCATGDVLPGGRRRCQPCGAAWVERCHGPGAVGAKSPILATVDARMPRAASIDVDLSVAGALVTNAIFVAYVGSSAGDLPLALPTTSTTASVPPVTISDMVNAWPYTAARVVHFGPARPT